MILVKHSCYGMPLRRSIKKQSNTLKTISELNFSFLLSKQDKALIKHLQV